MNVGQRQTTADPQTKPTDLGYYIRLLCFAVTEQLDMNTKKN